MSASINTGNRPAALLDVFHRTIEPTFNDTAMRGDNNGGSNLVYIGKARPGASEAVAVWQIRFLQYDGNGNVTSIKWPQNVNGDASNDYEFIWANRATYTYS